MVLVPLLLLPTPVACGPVALETLRPGATLA